MNFLFLRSYIANNVSIGARLTYWILAFTITTIILAFLPFMRNAFIIIPAGAFALFFGWIFLPIELLAVIGVFSFIGVAIFMGRAGI